MNASLVKTISLCLLLLLISSCNNLRVPEMEKGLSIVIPAYKECDNLKPLCERVFRELEKDERTANIKKEMIVVDDNSRDGSVEVVEKLSNDYPIKIEVRVNEKGLSTAVIHGFTKARYNTLLVMDADLQHDPIYVPSVASPILNGEADFAVGSRNVGGGGVSKDWPIHRRIISAGATMLAAPLTTCTDPMSGFFSLPTELFLKHKDKLNPMGWKIGLELMVRCQCKNVKDVPIVFKDREHGESKLTMKENVLYVTQLAHLYFHQYALLIFLVLVGVLALFISLLQ